MFSLKTKEFKNEPLKVEESCFKKNSVFWIELDDIIIPCTKNIPDIFINMLPPQIIDIKPELVLIDDQIKKHMIKSLFDISGISIDMMVDNIIYRKIKNPIFIDILIGYISQSLNIVQICNLIKYTKKYINISNENLIKKLNTHIDTIDTESYIWNQMSSKEEYSYYQLKKRNWPVKKYNNLNWQTVAQKIGLVEKIYPDTAAIDHVKLFGERNEEHKNRVSLENADTNADEDNDEDNDDEYLFKLLNNKEKQIKRDEKLKTLNLYSNYSIYSIPDIEEIDSIIGFNKKDVVDIFDSIIIVGQLQSAVLYVCKLFLSRKYYHLIIKNVPFMTRVKDLIKKNLRIHKLFKYVMSYSFYMMLKEERLLGRKISDNNRSIMDEDEFRSLPIFDCEVDDSPYYTEIYHNKKQKNLSDHLHMYIHGRREFTSRKTFLDRLSIMAGKMLDGIDLSKHNAFLTGSALVPCVVTNPLEEHFETYDKPFETYVENYYPSYSSINLFNNKFKYCKIGLIELLDYNFKSQPSIKLVYNGIKENGIFVKCMIDMSEDITYAFSNVLKEEVKTLFNIYEELLLMEKKIVDLDIAIIATSKEDYDKSVFNILAKIRENLPEGLDNYVYLYKQPLKYGFKWVLKGPGAKRPIDFFKIWTSPYALLYKFHLNIVRFWWDGDKVRALCSGVCAALTGVNQWYRWFSNNKDPMDIVLKNIQRGYTTLLNHNEISTLEEYISEVDKYKYIANKFTNGKVSINHSIFVSNDGGIRYKIPTVIIYNHNDIRIIINNNQQHWQKRNYKLNRIDCTLEYNMYGKIISPKTYALNYIIIDLLD
jgi:hypothetical protein